MANRNYPNYGKSQNDTSSSNTAAETYIDMREPGSVVIALYEYEPTWQNDIPFKKGDKMMIVDTSDNDWWKAISLRTKVEGFIPGNYVAVVNSVDCEEWFHGEILRKEAENLLLSSRTGTGTFLIRNSKKITDGYALSLLCWNATAKEHTVKHYVIAVTSEKYYIEFDIKFNNLQELVKFYSANSHGLQTRLLTPCPKTQPHLWDLSSETKDNWEVDRKTIQLINILEELPYGQVWLGNFQGDVPTKVAVKMLIKPALMSPEAFMAEATIMKSLHHKNLVSLYAVCKEEPIWIITEHVPNGSLLAHLQSAEGRQLPLKPLLEMAAQVASGMSYLESRQLIHRDLAARNILVGENNTVKIANFGIARIIQDDVYIANSKIGLPIKWTAPEVFLYRQYSVKSDVWSFGILLMEIVTHGAAPYGRKSNEDVYVLVPSGYRMGRPKNCHCPEDLYDLMKQCWDSEPQKRPKFDYLFAFLNDYAVSKEDDDYLIPSSLLHPQLPNK